MNDRREVHLRVWLDGEPLDDPMSRILGLVVEERTDAATTLRMVLPMIPIEGDWDLLEQGVFQEENGVPDLRLLKRVSVELSVDAPDATRVEAAAVVFDGYVTVVEPIFGEARQAESVLEIFALDASCLMHFDARIREWHALTDAQIVARIYEEYGFASEVTATAPSRALERGTMVQRCTDAEFVRMLARRNGFEAYVEFDPEAEVAAGPHPGTSAIGHFRPPATDGEIQPPLALFPENAPTLIAFRARWESHRPTLVRAWHIDEFTRRIHRIDERDSGIAPMGEQDRESILRTELDRILGSRPGVEATALQFTDVPHDATELATLARADNRQSDWFVSGAGTVQCERYPTILRPRRPVTLEGAGHLLDGTWYVQSVRHRWGADPDGGDEMPDPQGPTTVRYEADVEMVRNTLGGAP